MSWIALSNIVNIFIYHPLMTTTYTFQLYLHITDKVSLQVLAFYFTYYNNIYLTMILYEGILENIINYLYNGNNNIHVMSKSLCNINNQQLSFVTIYWPLNNCKRNINIHIHNKKYIFMVTFLTITIETNKTHNKYVLKIIRHNDLNITVSSVNL